MMPLPGLLVFHQEPPVGSPIMMPLPGLLVFHQEPPVDVGVTDEIQKMTLHSFRDHFTGSVSTVLSITSMA